MTGAGVVGLSTLDKWNPRLFPSQKGRDHSCLQFFFYVYYVPAGKVLNLLMKHLFIEVAIMPANRPDTWPPTLWSAATQLPVPTGGHLPDGVLTRLKWPAVQHGQQDRNIERVTSNSREKAAF